METDDKKNERDIVVLTGLPVSDELQDILDRCERGEYVSVEEINNTPEMKTAASCVSHQTPTFQMKDREQIEDHVFEILSNYGSVSLDDDGKPQVDGAGNTIYNGDVERGSRLDIVIGLPASGKSSAIVDTISYTNRSMLIDNDEAKRLFPEFNKGWGAGVVHAESQMVERSVYLDALNSGKNIVLPKVGSDAAKLIQDYILPAKNKGYKVNVHFVDLDRSKSLGRMLNRFIHKGRYLAPELIDKYVNEKDGNRIGKSFELLSKSSMIDGISRWDNDVGFGMPPKLKQTKGLTDDFVTDAHIEYVSEDKVSKLLGELIESSGIKSEMHSRDFHMLMKVRSEENRNMSELLKSMDHPEDVSFMKVIQNGMRSNLYDMQRAVDDIYKAIDALGGRDKLPEEMQTAVLHFEVKTAVQGRDVSRVDTLVNEMILKRDELVEDSVSDNKEIDDKENGGTEHEERKSDRNKYEQSPDRDTGELRNSRDSGADRGGASQGIDRDEREHGGDRQPSEDGSPQTKDGDNEKAHESGGEVIDTGARHPYKEYDNKEVVGVDDTRRADMNVKEDISGQDISGASSKITQNVSMSTDGQPDVNRQSVEDVVSDQLTALEIAERLDRWYQDYDLYGYKDDVEDTEQNIKEMAESIESGQTDHFINYLSEAVEENHSDPETLAEAKNLIKILDEYKPLAKVEEIEEQNYNMIDNRINNVAPKEEREPQKQEEKRISADEKFPGARYSHFRIEKRIEDKKYNLIADVRLRDGKVEKNQVIGEFKDKATVEDFCRQNNIAYDDITNYLQNRIDNKKKKVNEKQEAARAADTPGLGKKGKGMGIDD